MPTTGSFSGVLWPPQVVQQIINLLIEGAPFSKTLTRYPTGAHTVAFPTAQPTGWSWLAELAPVPVLNIGDSAYETTVCKIAGIVDISNESITDTAYNVTANLSTVLTDSLSRDLDLGILNGAGAPAPVGVTTIAPVTAGTALLAATAAAKGSIADAGGTATHLAINGTRLAAEDAVLSTAGGLAYPNGFAAAVGLTPVVVPALALADTMVYDSSRVFLVVRNDAMVEATNAFHFNLDAVSIRIKARVSAAVPAPNKAIRKLSSVTLMEANAGSGRK